jgi:uncharacterized iron-regulated protein
MHIKSVVSAAALSAALLFSGSAYAQTMFNGSEVSAEDLPALQERCEMLGTAASTQSLSDNPTQDGETAGDAAAAQVPDVNEIEQATTTLDLDTVTLEQCTEAGIKGTM